jgi:CHAT domain-containing protein
VLADMLQKIFIYLSGMAAIGFPGASLPSVPQAQAFDCRSSDDVRELEIPAGGDLPLQSSAGHAFWLRLDMQGYLVEVSGVDQSAILPVAVPFRFGSVMVALQPGQSVQLRRASASTPANPVKVSARCSQEPANVQRLAWWRKLSALAQRFGAFIPAAEAPAALAEADAIAAAATTPADQALATHARAQTLLLSGRSADAAQAFAAAELAWQRIGDPPRARVARVARVEELQRLGHSGEVLQLTADLVPRQVAADYMTLRLQLARCLALRYTGDISSARECFQHGVAYLEKQGETLDLVSALQDLADLARLGGDTAGARRSAEKALALCTLPGMEGHRGRLLLLLADLAVEDGDIAAALQRLDAALAEFTALKWPRWEANAALNAAELYLELGALDEADDFTAAALARLSERDAPARVAAVQVLQARIAQARGQLDGAARGLQAAADTYRRLGMRVELDSVQLSQGRLALLSGDAAGLAALLAARDPQQKGSVHGWKLVLARQQAADGRCAAAQAQLAQLASAPLPLAQQLDRAETAARCMALAGDSTAAQQLLLRQARNFTQIIGRVRAPLLRQVLLNQIYGLRRAAFRLPDSRFSADNMWQWIQISNLPPDSGHARLPAGEISRFDAEVARELLQAQAPATRQTARHLVAVLAEPAGAADTPAAAAGITLEALQQRLPAGTAYVTHADTAGGAQLLWVTRDTVNLLPSADSATLAAANAALLALLASPDSSLQHLDEAALRLSALLWPAARRLPERLLVDADSLLAVLPWPLLSRRPGQPAQSVSRVMLARLAGQPPPARRLPRDLTLLLAPQQQSQALSVLMAAQSDPALLAAALPGRRVHSLLATERETVLAAFAAPGSWLHVASHGSAVPGRIGQSGIWLEPRSATESPRFLSGLEILARGAASDLVVLSACRLASQERSTGGLGFADTLSRAGVREVVAVRWQVSDAAAALWGPAFYSELGKNEDVGAALAAAQQRLQESRAFRHPFYWAGYVHLGQL